MVSPLETRPKTVAIVALGPSNHDFVSSAACKKNFLQAEEVWVINSAIDTFCADKGFIMDDLKGIERRFPEWAAKLTRTKTPIVTCRAYKDFPTTIDYPLDAIKDDIQDDYFSNSVAYAIAYAIHIKVHDLYLFGCDFWYPGSQAVESGLACCAYLLGIAKQRGINYRIPQSSTMLDAHLTKVGKDGKTARPLYGYDYNPGEMKEKVARGTASKEEELLAGKAPKPLKKSANAQPELNIPPNGEDKEESNGVYNASP